MRAQAIAANGGERLYSIIPHDASCPAEPADLKDNGLL